MRARLVLVPLFSLVLGSSVYAVGLSPAFAPERIVSFRSEASLARDNTLTVTETIDYDFGTTPHHGIFRDIPNKAKDSQGHTYYWQVQVTDVTDGDGNELKNSRPGKSGFTEIKIGDPDRLITGRHVYRISYTLQPLVRRGDSVDVLGFNVTGEQWQVPIEAASVRLVLPDAPRDIRCFTGVSGSRANNCTVAASGKTVKAVTRQALQPGEGLSVFTDLPPDSLSEYLAAGQRPPLPLGDYFGFVGAGVLALLAFLWAFGQRLAYRLARRRETIVPLYEPPDKLTPAELGYLIDNKGSLTEVTATLIDLAVRGYLKIEQTEKSGLFKKAKYKLTRLANNKPLADYERGLYDAVFAGGNPVTLDNLDKTKMSAAVSAFQSRLKDRLEKRGYYAAPRRRWPWLILPLALVIATVQIGLGIAQHVDANLIVWGAISPVAASIFTLYFMLRSRATTSGIHEWAAVEGFRDFLSATEKDRLKFTDAPERTPKLFSTMLPFATALGVEKDWAKQFAGIDVAKATESWYHGTYAFSATDLSSDVGSSFSGAVSSNFSSSSTSSGGFSGGGGGGGGGGSW